MSSSLPNIVFILTDQERHPRFMSHVNLDHILPARAHLRKLGVSYENFYINAAPCTPNRSVIFTGLYTQQTWMVGNAEMKQPDMSPDFPTFGTALRNLGYSTNYFGKWHLSTEPEGNDGLAAYGFENFPLGKEFHGNPNQGRIKDPLIADEAAKFLAQKHEQPFLAVISFINPHDIMYYPNAMIPRKPGKTYLGMSVPPNFETVEELRKNKPECQAQYKNLYELVMGNMPDNVTTPEGKQAYIEYMNYYLWLQEGVDGHIGHVIRALEGSENKNNTIVIFTSDHGDQIGSHGLSGKQCCAYEESLNVPFYVVDYGQRFIPTHQVGTKRMQLGSSIDIFPTILSMATAPGAERPAGYEYLSGVDLLPNIIDDSKDTKSEVLFTYDFNIPGVVPGPDHIRCLINADWKGAVYNHWGMDNGKAEQPTVEEGAVDIPENSPVQRELYKRSHDDKLELENLAERPGFQAKMEEIEIYLNQVMQTKLRAPLPEPMQTASNKTKEQYVALQVYEVTAPEVKQNSKDYLG